MGRLVGTWGLLVVMVTLALVCELEAAKTKKPAAGEGASKRRTFKLSHGRPCNPNLSTECNVHNLLVCHPVEKKCVCIYTIHEWADAELGCYNPQDGKPGDKKEAEEVDKEGEKPATNEDLDAEVPPPDEKETEDETRRRRKFARIQRQSHSRPKAKRGLTQARNKATKKPKKG